MAVPLTKPARQARISALVRRTHVHSQTELAELLAGDGIVVTQATLSRDLEDLGAVKVRDGDGQLVYTVNGEAPVDDDRLARVLGDLVVSVEAAHNMVVVRTPPGGAQFVASALDRAELDRVLGTVAGDDTVLVACRGLTDGARVARALMRLAGR